MNAPEPNATVDLPLAGVRVIDSTDGLGETAGRYLADLGADVILVEPPGGARSRELAPLPDSVGLYFAVRNANKRGVCLDPYTAEGREHFLALVESADIWLENGLPGSRPVELEVVRARNPRLVVVSITDFGQTGPYRDWAGTGRVHLALAGLLSRSGIPGREPLLPPGAIATESAALQAAWCALLAYYNRLETGRGEHVDFSVYEAVTQVVDPGFGIGGSATGGVPPGALPRGRPPAGHLYPIFACADGHVRITLLGARQWRGMRAWLGEPAELADPKYESLGERFKAAGRIYPMIGALFADQPTGVLVAEGQRRGVPIAALLRPDEVLRAGHFRERGAFADLEVAPGVSGFVPTGFLEVDGRRAGLRRRAPRPGEHTEEVFADLGRGGGISRTGNGQPPGPPLAGLRVLDLGVIVAGAELGRLLADHGADVLKVESRAFPDGSRQSGTGEAITASFTWGHRNKRDLGLNLRDPEGAALFKEFVAAADVVLSNFKPGTMESLGLGYDELKKVNSRVVVVESSAFGGRGRWSKRMGYGPLVRASSGLTSLWRYPDDEGGFSDGSTIYPDHVVGRVGAAAVLAKLIARRRTGTGGTVDIAQAEIILAAMADRFLAESLRPGSLTATGNVGALDAPQGVYPCAGDDEWCVVDVRDDTDWRRLCDVIGKPDLAADYPTSADRLAARAEIDRDVADWTSTRHPRKAMELLQQAGVPAGFMQRVGEYIDDPQLSARGAYTEMSQPGVNEQLFTEARPARFEHIPDPPLAPAPYPGEHTREVCAQWLGLSTERVEELLATGVLEETVPDGAR